MSERPTTRRRGGRPLPVVFPDSELQPRTWITLVRLFARMERQMELALAGHDLSLPQFEVLAVLRHEEGITQQQLAQRLLVTKGNVCTQLDRMAALGWVERRHDPEDRRANRLYLTRAGKGLLDAVLPHHHECARRLLSPLDGTELRSFYQLLARLDEAIEENPQIKENCDAR